MGGLPLARSCASHFLRSPVRQPRGGGHAYPHSASWALAFLVVAFLRPSHGADYLLRWNPLHLFGIHPNEILAAPVTM
jgi:hypothetical protein